MPGLLETTLHQVYGYLDPYVERARHAVPLIDQAAKKAQQFLPPLITRADEIAEPKIEQMRPYVEPRIEQVKEVVAPYLDEGVKKYEVIREGGTKYYQGMKDFKNAKTTKIKHFTDVNVAPRVEKIKYVVEPQVKKVTAVIRARQQKAQTLLRVPAHRDLHAVPAYVDLQSLNTNISKSLLEKVAVALEKTEAFLKRHLPLAEDQKQDCDDSVEMLRKRNPFTSNLSDASFRSSQEQKLQDCDNSDSSFSSAVDSESSYAKINRSLFGIRSQLLTAFTVNIRMLLTFPVVVKEACVDGTAKEKSCKYLLCIKTYVFSQGDLVRLEAKKLLGACKEKVVGAASMEDFSPKAKMTASQLNEHLRRKFDIVFEKSGAKAKDLTPTSVLKKILHLVVACSEKTVGTENTAAVLSKIELYIPAALRAEPADSVAEPTNEKDVGDDLPAGLRKRNKKQPDNPDQVYDKDSTGSSSQDLAALASLTAHI